MVLIFLLLAATFNLNNGLSSVITASAQEEPTNAPPVANAGSDQLINEGTLVTLNGTASSDPDGDPITYSWNQTSGTPVTLDDVTSVTPSFTAPDVGSEDDILIFELTVTDNDGANSTDSVSVTVTDTAPPPNSAPTADAGNDQIVSEGDNVTLNGTSSSDPDGDTLTYSWNQTAGPVVVLSNSSTATPSFTAPEVNASGATITFELTVSDGNGGTISDTVYISVENINQPPVADAGVNQTVNEGDTVLLDGTNSSDPDGDPLTYSWSQTAGTPITLDNATSATPSFTAPDVGSSGDVLAMELTVTDSEGNTDSDSVSVSINDSAPPPNSLPISDAGSDQTVYEGDAVTLNGTGSSDPDGDALTYSWVQISGSPVTLSDPDTDTPTFTAPDVGSEGEILTFELTVTDSVTAAAKDTVQVTILNVNKSPIANAGGDQAVNESDLVTLDGSASSDPDSGDTLTYSWSQTSGASVILSDANATNPTFNAPNVGSGGDFLIFRLDVQDDHGASSFDEVSITVNNVNGLPTANAGTDQTVFEETTVILNGSDSYDPDDDPLTYSWSQTSGPIMTLPSNTDTKDLSFTAPSVSPAGTILVFQLTVDDGITGSSIDYVEITVNNVNVAPLADAGSDLIVDEGDNVTLNGTASTDADGDSLAYSWVQTAGPAVALSNSSSPTPSFTAPNVDTAGATLTFELTVTDTGGLSRTDTVNVAVNNVNQFPVADAGPDQTVNEGDTVNLSSANSSDPDGDSSSMTFLWKQMDGSPATLQNADTSTPSFIAPNVGSTMDKLSFRLVVTDNAGSVSTDDVNVTVNNVAGYHIPNYSPSFSATGSSYYDIPDSSSLRLTKFTATVWFKTSSSFSGNAMIVNKGGFGSDSAGENMNYGMWFNSNEKLVAGFETSGGTDYFVVSSKVYNDGSWHYAVVTYDGSIIRLYVDGVGIGTKSTTATPETNVSYPLRIGANSNPNGNINYFVGEIDEVRIWNRAVTDTEVLDQYNLGISDKSGLLVHFNGICHICAPIANAGTDLTVDENLEVTLDGSASYDLNGGGLTYSWIQISGSPVAVSDPNIPNPTFTAPSVAPSDTLTFEHTDTDSADDTLTFEMTVTNSDGLTSTDTVVIFVQNVNQLPIADAGPDQTVNEGSFVTLNGSASSDPDGDGLTFLWTQTTGPTVLLDNALSVNPTFTAPEVMKNGATLTFELVVDDGHGGNSSDSADVFVQHVNKPPVSNAGVDQTVFEGDSVTLDGSGSFDPDGNTLTYSWIQVAGTTITLNNANTDTPSFTAPSVASGGDVITVELTATDSDGVSSTDAVNIQVNNINILPVADAGSDQTVNEGDSVMLDGTLSIDLDGIISPYSWEPISGAPSVLLDGQNTSNPTFTAPYVTGDDIRLIFELTVMDNDQGTNSDNVTITIQNINQAPIADAGSDQTVSEHDSVILNGSASYDNDGSIVSFLWIQTSGPTATLTDATAATPSFVAPEVYSGGVTLAFKLSVTDDYGEPSSINDVSIYVMNINQPPIADAGLGQTVDEGTLVTLNGTESSDPDGDILSFNWTQIAGPSVTLSDRFVAEPTFTAPEVSSDEEILTFELMVHDGEVEDALTDFVDIIVRNVNKPPIADAGNDQSVDEGTVVTLDGTASFDPDGITLSYTWTQTAGHIVALSNANTSTTSFTTPNIGTDLTTLTFQLTVNDILGGNDTDTVDIVVQNIPGYSNNNYSPSLAATGSSYFDIPDHSSLRLKTFTAAAWFKTSSSFSGNVMIVNKGGFGSDSAGQNMNYGIWMDGNEKIVAGFETSGGADHFVVSSSKYNDGKWHYAVVTYDGAVVRLYIDGVQIGTKSTTATPETNTSYPLRLGANSRGTNNYFTGEIDEVRIWARAVASQEVSDQYEFGTINKQGRIVKMNGVDYDSIPTAKAGPDLTVYEFEAVSLDGTASSDPDGDTLTYLWVQTAGPTVALDDSSSAAPSFVGPEVYSGGAALTFELTVDDGDSTSSGDIVNVIVKNINLAPAVDAGSDQTVDEGDIVTLDGTESSDPDGDNLSFSWRQTFGPSVALSDASTATPMFTAPFVTSATTLTFELSVNDPFTSNKDVVNVFVNDVVGGYNNSPAFSATGSNLFDIPDSSSLRLQQFTTAAWFNTSSSFSGNAMIVNKGGFGSDSAGQNMNYGIWMDGNEKIVAGFETSGGADHFLTSSSTYNDDSWHYAVVTYDGSTLRLYIDGTQIASKSTSSAKPDSGGSYPLRLGANSRGTNNYFTGEIDEVRVWNRAVTSTEVSNQFNLATFDMTGAVSYMDGTEYDTPPTANAGSDRTVYEEDIVTLNGGGSSDPNGNPLAYTWTQINGPGIALSDANIPDPQFTAPSVSSTGAVLKFRLTISDGTFESTDEVSVTVKNLSSIFTATGSNYYDIKYVSSIGLQKFSLGAMFKTSSSFSGDAAIANRGGFGSESSGQNMNYGIWMNSAEKIVAGFETSGGADHFLTSSSTYNDDSWHYAVVTYDGSTLRLYIDGTQIASKSTTAKPDTGGTQALRVGANSRALDSYFVGQIDEVKLVNRALSSSEVTEQFQSTSQIIQGEVVYFDGEIAYFAPVAKAGPDQTVDEGNYVTLDGSGSFDVNGYPITYSWKQTSGPVTVSLSSHTAAEPVFKAPSVVDREVFTFQLMVNNGRYDSLDTVNITVDNVNVIAPRILITPDYKNDVTKAIKSADEYVYVSMFFVEVYSDNKPINELAAAKARGVDVKLIVSNHSLALYPSLESDLKAKGIPYRIDSTHAKVVVIDDKFAYIGSANWNKNGLGNNWELTYKSNNPSTIAEAKEFVTQLWFKGSNIVRNNNIFSERLVNGFEYEEQVLSILKNAKSSIKVLMFEATYAFKDPDATHTKILNEVKNAYGRGVDLKMIFDDPRYWIMYGGKEFWDKYDIPHKLDEKDSGYLERKHVKAFLVDDSILIIGSQNWNRDSAGSPQEMSVIIKGNPAMVNDEYQALFQNQWNLSDKCVVNQTVVSCS
jgi:phosphatidylserine/phosphatidylglycerophosphate/cardiolipin synthase-like enzyme